MLACALAACAGGGSSSVAPSGITVPPVVVGPTGPPAPQPTPFPSSTPAATPTPAPPVPTPTSTPQAQPTAPLADPRLRIPSGFVARTIATVGGARQLAALPNGDLLVGTSSAAVAIVRNAENAGVAGAPATFASLPDAPAQGVAFGGGFVFVATQHHVYRIPYASGAQSGTPQQIASVRTGGDGGHSTSTVAVSGSAVFVGVGSSCNACVETDPTRASVQRMALDGSGMTAQARRIRNPIALAADPSTGTVWAGVAGQDGLAAGHPYEFLDPISAHAAPADYGWPDCEENHVAYTSGANCASTVVPAIEFPAYSTIIGAAFYPASQSGSYAFPSAWSGGLYVSMHGSWHTGAGGVPIDGPHVAFVPFSGASPARAVNWSDPTAQWNDFFTGFQDASGARIGRTTGVAVGPQGSLFVADDQTGTIYRIRPAATSGSAQARRTR